MKRIPVRFLNNQTEALETYDVNGLLRLSTDINQDLATPLKTIVNNTIPKREEFINIIVRDVPSTGKVIQSNDYDLQTNSVFVSDVNNNNIYRILVNDVLLYEWSVKAYKFSYEVIKKGTPITIKHSKNGSLVNFSFIAKPVTVIKTLVY